MTVGFILLSVIIAFSHALCPNGWRHFQDSCFLTKQETLNWNDAQHACQGINARLAEVQTHAKVEFLRNMLSKEDGDWWIGAKDDVTEGQWRWASGELFDYTDWAPNEPNNDHDQDCLQMFKTDQYHWDDDRCDVAKHFICEKGFNSTLPVIG
ncbi:lectin BRA-3-like [Mytilus galloprovincialis]|uniref:C-type lectin 8 n=1 Tax=Mytilus galloprovincialis TaxID=29158 RepID=A0A0C5Q4F2_MYTGA|nr:C-type lectin 8 [Mytilus galloprovincialis]